ncbi:MAG: MauE/DoxX family redox-associated membrane protein [Actinomycetota bacterium]
MARVAALSLALTLGWAGLAKALRFVPWRSSLVGYRLPRGLFPFVLIGLPIVELGTAALLLTSYARAGAAVALALVSSFSATVVRARAIAGDRVPCGCFGGMKTRDYRLMLVRNAVLGLAAAAVMIRADGGSPLHGFAPPRASELLPAGLVVLGVVFIGFVAWQAALMSRGHRR